ncbi:MAG: hypothetical protein K2M98_04235 [Muribaculum sp.]|nr:hypothetical protein [Muribaculum sp.]
MINFVLMFETTRHIEYLLMKHDCVGVPGIGAFVAQYIPAEIDRESGRVYPPRRVFSFNRDINHDDGLLCASVARKRRVSYDIASEIVESEIRALRVQLDMAGEVSLGKVGTLKKTRSGELIYSGGDYRGLSPELSSSEPVALPGTDVAAALKIVRRRGIDNVMFRVASVAASVVIMLMLAISLTTPVVPDMAVKASMSIIGNDIAETVDTYDFNPQISLSIAVPDISSSSCETNVSPAVEDMKYVVVIASLANNVEAQKFIDEYACDDVKMSVLPGEKHYRIVVGGGDDLQALSGQLNAWRDRYPSAWIFQRR